jgi:Tol biopolymer transport system component
VAAPVTLALDAASDSGPVRRYGASVGWPQFLPDGRHFLFLHRDSKRVYLATLGTAESTPLLETDSHAIFAAPGFLLFVRDGALMAQPFDADARQLSGEPFRVVENIRFDSVLGGGVFSASFTGAIAYSAGQSLGPAQVTWMARDGRVLDSLKLDTISTSHRLSQDGRRLAHDRLGAGDRGDLWVFDLARRTSLRLTSSTADEEDPIWSPDGSQVAYAANPRGVFDLYRVSSTAGARESLLFSSPRDKWPEDWSADGRFIVFAQSSAEHGGDLWLLDLQNPSQPTVIVETPANERDARLSPDGRWIAFRSTRTGRPEIYIQPIPSGSAVLASVDGGFNPFWSADGKELFFVSLDGRLMSVPIRLDRGNPSSVVPELPMPLFTLPEHCGARCVGAGMAADGRFVLVTAATAAAAPMAVILNWPSLAPRPPGR